MSIFKSIGKAIKGIGKAAGSVVNSTVGKLPIVGGAATHIGNALNGKEPFLKGLIKGGAPLLLGAGTFGIGPAAGLMSKVGGLVGGKVAGAAGSKGFAGTALKGIGAAVRKATPGQLAGVAMTGAQIAGQAKQRKQNDSYNAANTDMRNQLMSRILAPQGYQP